MRGVSVQAERIKNAAVRAVAISDDCTHVLATYGAGFIFRHEYIAPIHAPAPTPEVEAEGQAEAAKVDTEA